MHTSFHHLEASAGNNESNKPYVLKDKQGNVFPDFISLECLFQQLTVAAYIYADIGPSSIRLGLGSFIAVRSRRTESAVCLGLWTKTPTPPSLQFRLPRAFSSSRFSLSCFFLSHFRLSLVSLSLISHLSLSHLSLVSRLSLSLSLSPLFPLYLSLSFSIFLSLFLSIFLSIFLFLYLSLSPYLSFSLYLPCSLFSPRFLLALLNSTLSQTFPKKCCCNNLGTLFSFILRGQGFLYTNGALFSLELFVSALKLFGSSLKIRGPVLVKQVGKCC